tara:strand:+ start:561 stop:1004 length:444 start_codon:yes stop_codon:yes gene_type:complete
LIGGGNSSRRIVFPADCSEIILKNLLCINCDSLVLACKNDPAGYCFTDVLGISTSALIPRSNGNNSSDQLEPVDPEEDEPRTGMFTIERLVDQGWKRELSCQTEFKAFLNARTRCMASGNTYRVINSDLDVICLITLDGCKRQYGAR